MEANNFFVNDISHCTLLWQFKAHSPYYFKRFILFK